MTLYETIMRAASESTIAVVAALLIAVIGALIGNIYTKKTVTKDLKTLEEGRIELENSRNQLEEGRIELENKKKEVEAMKKEYNEKLKRRQLQESEIYIAMDIISKIVEERQVAYYSVLDFIKAQNKPMDIEILLGKFNLSNTTMSTLCNELQDMGLLKIANGSEISSNGKMYNLTPTGQEVVDRFNNFFCFVLDNIKK